MNYYDEATGFENFGKHKVKKEDVPADFNKFILKVYDIAEQKGRKIQAAGVDGLKSVIDFAFIKQSREKLSKSQSNQYMMTINTGNLPKKAKNFVDEVCSAAGMHKGQKIGLGIMSGNYYYKKAKDKNGEDCYFTSVASVAEPFRNLADSISICFYCLKASASTFLEGVDMNRDFISSEFTSEIDCDKKIGCQGIDPEQLFGTINDLGLTRSEELARDEVYGNFFKNPKVMTQFTEHLDMSDKATRMAIINMNEADQTAILTSLTSKLYDHIVAKVDDIDYGDIPATEGDITKLPNYTKLVECVDLLKNILNEFKQDTAPIDEIAVAIANVGTRKDLFNRAFKLDCELPILMYNNTVLSIISAVSLMIATSIEFIKTPNKDSFQITLDKVAFTKTKNNMLYKNLKKFNKICENKEFDKAMNHIIDATVKAAKNEAAVGGLAVAGVVAVAVILANIVPILREMVFFFYYSRMRVSDFFDIQADLLQMNAYNVQNNESLNGEEKEKIVSKQFKIVNLFRSIANKISFTGRKAEVECSKEVANADRKLKIDELSDDPETASSLF